MRHLSLKTVLTWQQSLAPYALCHLTPYQLKGSATAFIIFFFMSDENSMSVRECAFRSFTAEVVMFNRKLAAALNFRFIRSPLSHLEIYENFKFLKFQRKLSCTLTSCE